MGKYLMRGAKLHEGGRWRSRVLKRGTIVLTVNGGERVELHVKEAVNLASVLVRDAVVAADRRQGA